MYHFLFFYYISPKMKCQGEGGRPAESFFKGLLFTSVMGAGQAAGEPDRTAGQFEFK